MHRYYVLALCLKICKVKHHQFDAHVKYIYVHVSMQLIFVFSDTFVCTRAKNPSNVTTVMIRLST